MTKSPKGKPDAKPVAEFGRKPEVRFERVAVIGIGLIGSSVVRALRAKGMAGHIAICDKSRKAVNAATKLGLADTTTTDAAIAAEGADLVVIATPLGAYADVAADIGPVLKEGAIVTDVGSTKLSAIRDIMPHVPDGAHLVPGHPVAGTEHSGPEAGFAELFDGRFCILTPPPGTHPDAVEKISAMWRAFGSKIEVMDAQHHDLVLAITSHLPHLIAYTIVGTATDLGESLKSEVIKYSAGGFRDFTRIAASDPVMWRDVFLNNKEAVLEVLQRFSEDLTALQRAIRWGEGDKLFEAFSRTRAIRQGVIKANQAE